MHLCYRIANKPLYQLKIIDLLTKLTPCPGIDYHRIDRLLGNRDTRPRDPIPTMIKRRIHNIGDPVADPSESPGLGNGNIGENDLGDMSGPVAHHPLY